MYQIKWFDGRSYQTRTRRTLQEAEMLRELMQRWLNRPVRVVEARS